MIEMIRRSLRQKSRNVGTLVVLGLLAVFSALALASTGKADSASSGLLGLLVLAAAAVSRDASSGALQMILARPIRRTDYLFGRYLGILAGFAAFLVIVGLVALVMKTAWLQDRVRPLTARVLLENVGFGALWAAPAAAVLLFFSTFLPGYGDVIAFVTLQILLSLRTNVASVEKVVETLRREILPNVPWARVFAGDPAALADAGRATLATAIFLTAAAFVFSRREFGYGRD
jgi:hypothetical protein